MKNDKIASLKKQFKESSVEDLEKEDNLPLEKNLGNQ